MSQKILCSVLLCFFLFFTPARAAELWSVGKLDGSCAEFALSGDWNEAAKKLPSGTIKKLEGLDPKTDWPWIHAGPVDVWGGSVQYLLGLEFDLPNLDEMKKDGIIALELRITAAGHNSEPPTLAIDLNGTAREMKITPCGKGAQILAIPTAADWKTQKVLFPIDAAKKTGNLLKIVTEKGDWMVYDAIQLFSCSENIEKLNITSRIGWLRNPDETSEAVKRFTVDFDGNILAKPADLSVAMTTAENQTYRIEKKLDPKTDAQGTEITVPMNVTDKPIEATLELKTDGKTVASSATIPAERKWELHIIHQTHLDVGYTHKQEEVLALQVQSIKDSLKYIEETKDYPDDAKFKFHPEGMWAVEEFMKTATEAEKAAFIQAARKRDIHLDVLYAQAMTGMYSDEELFELMGAAVRFGRKYDVVIDSAMQSDVPGYVWGLVPVLAKNGVKYMTMAPNPGHRVGRVYEWGDKPFYWESPSGKEKVLCWVISTSYNMFHFQPVGYEIPEERFFGILADFESKDFPYDIAQFRYCIEKDNGRPNRVISDQVKAWNEKYVYPKLILSRNSDVMRELENRYADKIPTIRGDYTPYWEDGAASTAAATGACRTGKTILTNTEIVWACDQAEKYPEKVAEFDAAWTKFIMYDEHTWGAHNSIAEPDSEFVKHQDDFKQAYAFGGFQETMKLAPSNIMKTGGGGASVLYSANREAGECFADPDKGIIGNNLFTLTIDKKTGAISSLKYKGIDEDFVKPGDDGNSGLNDFLYITGRDAAKNRERIATDAQVEIVKEDAPDSTVCFRIESAAPHCPTLIRYVLLYDDCDIIALTSVMSKEMVRKPEGVFFGFPFNIPGGKWRVDTPWAMVEVEKDQLPGGNRNFYCVQRFCNYSNDDYGVDWMTIHAPMMQFAPIKYTPAWDINAWRDHIEPGGTIYSWVCNNHWETNYKAGQDGRLLFTYLIRPYKGQYDAAKSQKRGRLDLIEEIAKLVQLSNDNVLITRLKPCREFGEKKDSPYGPGLLVRLYNPTKEQQTVSLDFRTNGKKYDAVTVYDSNPLEDRLEKIEGEITIAPLDFITIRAE